MLPQKNQIKFKRGFKKWADDTSTRIRVELGLRINDPLCAFELCKHLSVPIFTPQEFKTLEDNHKIELLTNGRSEWSAVTIPVNDSNIIIHNPTHSPQRQQSNLMHEVAHILCEHKVSNETQKTGLSGFLRNLDIEQENEADWLGACLQLPRPALLYCLKRNMTVDEISIKYNSSLQMTRYRINVTGVKNQLKYKRNYAR